MQGQWRWMRILPPFAALAGVLAACVVAAPAFAATAQTGAATDVKSTTARVVGVIDPGGVPAIVYVDYGSSAAYGSTVDAGAIAGSGVGPVDVSVLLTGLGPATTYHYRFRVDGSTGADAVFTTPEGPPASVTRPRLRGSLWAFTLARCERGTWLAATSYRYAWSRDGDPLHGETAATYRLRRRDIGTRVTCTVTASGPGGDASRNAAAVVVKRPCVVPQLRGHSIAVARRLLVRNGCRAGAVRVARSRLARGRVVRPGRKVGKILAPGTRVPIIVSG